MVDLYVRRQSEGARRLRERKLAMSSEPPKPSHPQIVIDAPGRLAVAWDESVNGRRVAAVRELRTERSGGVTFGEVVTLAEDGPAMYGVLAATETGLVAV